MEFQFPDCEPKSAANMHTQGRQLSANLRYCMPNTYGLYQNTRNYHSYPRLWCHTVIKGCNLSASMILEIIACSSYPRLWCHTGIRGHDLSASMILEIIACSSYARLWCHTVIKGHDLSVCMKMTICLYQLTNNEVYKMVISDLDFDLLLNGYEVPAYSQISTIFVTNRSSV